MAHPEFSQIGDVEDRAIEECSELIQIICKCRRFGMDNYHPDDVQKTPNWKLTIDECEDVERVVTELKAKLTLRCAPAEREA